MATDYGAIAQNGLNAFLNGEAGWSLGSSSNPAEALANLLNFGTQVLASMGTATPAGQAANAFVIGLSQAATANNSLSAYQKFENGTIQPSDVLNVTSSILGGMAAAAALTGLAVPATTTFVIAAIAVAAGPSAQDAVNAALNKIGEMAFPDMPDTDDAGWGGIGLGPGFNIPEGTYDLGPDSAGTPWGRVSVEDGNGNVLQTWYYYDDIVDTYVPSDSGIGGTGSSGGSGGGGTGNGDSESDDDDSGGSVYVPPPQPQPQPEEPPPYVSEDGD
ncbi:hypothetical protein DLREEDagrD3_15970 [Denitratisoma sp. agr-D3]